MNYKQKADQINKAVSELGGLYKDYPLLNMMIKNKAEFKIEFYRRVNSELAMHGKAKLGEITEELIKKYDDVWRKLSGK